MAVALPALALHAALQPWLGPSNAFLIHLPAVALTAAWGGTSAALAVLLAGVAATTVSIGQQGGWHTLTAPDVGRLVLDLALGTLLVWLDGSLRRSLGRTSIAEDRLAMAIQGTGIGVFDVDLVERSAYASPALARMVGLPGGSLSLPFSTWLQHLPADVLDETRQHLQRRLAEGAASYEREISLPQAHGEPVGLMLRIQVAWEDGQPVRLRGACVDITEHNAVRTLLAGTRAELSQQRDDLHQLHELSTQLLETATFDTQLSMILVALVRFHGASRGLLSLAAPGGGPLRVQASAGFSADAIEQAGALDGSPCALALGQGTRVIIEDTETAPEFSACLSFSRREGFRAVHSTPLISSQGDVMGVMTVHLEQPRRPTRRECALADICARKAAVFIERARARQDLLESQGRFEAVLEASAAPFAVLQPFEEAGRIVDFRWVYVNRAAARVIGRPARRLVGRRVLPTLPQAWTQGAEFALCVQVVEDQRTIEFDTVSRTGDTPRWFHCIASPIRDNVALWFTDISERIRNEQLLRLSDRRKDELLATLAHELRNPLAPIRLAAQLSMSPKATETQRRWASEVTARQVRHMALLLDDLMDVSRITRGALPLRKAATDLDDVVTSAIETARPLIDAKGHVIHVHVADPPIALEADALRLAQVVANLLTNAAKYTEPGGTIRLSARRQGDEVVIEVLDNGIGIPPEAVPEVFQMFTQLRQADDRTGGGLGIGLALAKGLVELHGGSITASSDGPGRGSLFTVTLPVGSSERPLPPPREDEHPPATHRYRVLIADDNRDASDTLGALLGLEGHEPLLAYDGDEALAIWRRFTPQVCLLDIGMPGRSGYEVARLIRSSPGGEAVFLVAITGWSQAPDRQAALEAGFDLHLTKPVNPRQIVQLLARRNLHAGGPGGTLTPPPDTPAGR